MGGVGGKRVAGLGVLGDWVSGGRLTAGGARLRAGHAQPLRGGGRVSGCWPGTGRRRGQDPSLRCGRLEGGYGKRAGRACPAPTGWRKKEGWGRHQLPASLPLTQSLHKRYMFPLDVTRWMVYTVGRRTVLSHYILCQFFHSIPDFMKGAFPMLPCQKNCHAYCPGCHKSCPHFRAMQEQQRRDLARKKEYLRRADESCRAVLHQCRAAGGYLGPLPY